ncbi:MAG: outer membrane protein transport protein [Alphaproteobacteria bacterium]|nr:outer membrane protein transport protein [Alphaproteobacteria bacterium]
MKKQNLSILVIALVASQAHAAGYQLQEYSVNTMGRAFSGAGVVGDDYSAIAYNPAGMNFVQKNGVQAGAVAINLHARLRGESTDAAGVSSSDRTSTNIFRIVPNFFGQYNLNDKASLGLGLYVPYGLSADYKNNWYGTAHGQYSGITVVNLTPALSYKLTDQLTLGAGLNIQYTQAHLTGGLPVQGTSNMRADDSGLGYIVGVTYKPIANIRLGASYRSAVTHKLKGNNKVDGSILSYLPDGKYDVFAKITTPETVTLSAAYDVNKKWTLSGTARWTRWDRFKYLNIIQDGFGATPVSSTYENWKNTWFYSLGADYKYCDNLTFRFGAGLDNTPIKSPKYRTARVPDERRILTSLGASYHKNNWQLDVGYTHIFIRKARAQGMSIQQPGSPAKFDSTYHLSSDIVGLQYQYNF